MQLQLSLVSSHCLIKTQGNLYLPTVLTVTLFSLYSLNSNYVLWCLYIIFILVSHIYYFFINTSYYQLLCTNSGSWYI